MANISVDNPAAVAVHAADAEAEFSTKDTMDHYGRRFEADHRSNVQRNRDQPEPRTFGHRMGAEEQWSMMKLIYPMIYAKKPDEAGKIKILPSGLQKYFVPKTQIIN